MPLLFVDGFEHTPAEDLTGRFSLSEGIPTPKYPGVYTIEARGDGTAEVVRQYEGNLETRVLHAGESAWGISWNGTSHSVTADAWDNQ